MHRFQLHQPREPFHHETGQNQTETKDIDANHNCSDLFTRSCPQVHVTSFHGNPLKPYLSSLESSPQQARGSGFVIASPNPEWDSVVVVTNHHVIDSHQKIECTFPHSGQVKYQMKVVLDDPAKDIAILQFREKAPEWVATMEMNDSDTLFNGTVNYHSLELVAVGYPLGGGLKETKGGANGMEYLQGKSYIQTDAALNSGNSGGPCISYDEVSGDPKVYGVNAAIMQGRNTIGYAIPINVVKQCIEEHFYIKNNHPEKLIGGVAIRRPFLGISGFPGIASVAAHYNNQRSGFHVQYVYPDTMFHKTLEGKDGLTSGDEIVSINDREVNEVGQVIPTWSNTYIPMENYLESLAYGKTVKVGFLRKNEFLSKNFMMTPKCDPFKIKTKFSPYEKVGYAVVGGMVFTELTDQTLSAAFRVDPTLGTFLLPENRTKPRLILTHVFGHSQVFQNHTIGPGALLRRVNGEEVYTAEDVDRIIQKASTRKDFTFSFNHHRKVFMTTATMHEELKVIDDQNIHLNAGVQTWMKNWCTRKTKKILMKMQDVVNQVIDDEQEEIGQRRASSGPTMNGVSYMKTSPLVELDPTKESLTISKEENPVKNETQISTKIDQILETNENKMVIESKVDKEVLFKQQQTTSGTRSEMDEVEYMFLRELLPDNYEI